SARVAVGHLQAGALFPRGGIPQVSPRRPTGCGRETREAFAIRIERHEPAIRDTEERPAGGDGPDRRFLLYPSFTSALRDPPAPHGCDASTVGAERGIPKGGAFVVEVEQLLAVQIPDGEAARDLFLSPRGGGGYQGVGAGDISEAVSAG